VFPCIQIVANVFISATLILADVFECITTLADVFSLYKNSFNALKDAFFKVKARKTDLSRRILFHENYAPRFPLYWLIPTKFKSRAAHQLMAQEKVNIKFLIDFRISYSKPLPTKDLMDSIDAKEPDQYLKGE